MGGEGGRGGRRRTDWWRGWAWVGTRDWKQRPVTQWLRALKKVSGEESGEGKW